MVKLAYEGKSSEHDESVAEEEIKDVTEETNLNVLQQQGLLEDLLKTWQAYSIYEYYK